MELKTLKTKEEYTKTLQRFETIFQAETGTKESDEADVLALLIKDFEERHYLIEAPDPIEAIKYRMEQQGLSDKELAEILGYKSGITKIFNKSRKLNIDMVRKLHEILHIPLQTLIKAY